MLHRTLNVLTALALLGILLVIVGLLWLKRRVWELVGLNTPLEERPQFWPAMRPQTAG
jgi:hypothetical protein